VFIFSNGPTQETERTNRISRFYVERAGPVECRLSSERVIIEWHSQGHDGGGLVFGHDGMLYISTGDGTSDSDGWMTGQDISDLLGGVLRIDVDKPKVPEPQNASSASYSIPKDNPFVGVTNARPELWAYGLRNPWRLAIDQKSGQIWAGNNGQDLWETAHLIRRGENYGWSVYEGSHPFYLNRKPGPTAVVPPTVEHSHSEMRSLTGGAVYYGAELSDLNGFYIYGDYSTGEIWGVRHDGSKVRSWKRLAQTSLQITSFALDAHGRLLITDHGGGVYHFIPSPRQKLQAKFPTHLSETGLFLSVREHRVQPALIPYSVNAPAWMDGATAERFMAFPDDSFVGHLTNGAVLVQTLSLERTAGVPTSRQRIETRVLTRQGGQWAGYSFSWNEQQTEARLVSAKGSEREFVIKDASAPRGSRRQVWRYPSRVECMTCHSRAANFALGITELQLNKIHNYGAVSDNQLRALHHVGIFPGNVPSKDAKRLVNPYDPTEELEVRARSYLHVNCSICHIESGGGNARMELGFTTIAEKMNLTGARPQHDTFGIDNPMLIFPGDPARSIVYARLSRRGPGQMPPLATREVDREALHLFGDWIRHLKPDQPFVRDWQMEDLIPSLNQLTRGRSYEAGRAAFRQTGCAQCHRFDGQGGGVGPALDGVGKRLSSLELLESVILPSKVIAEGYAIIEIETKGGTIIAGRIEREDARVLSIQPQASSQQPVSIRKADIQRGEVSNLSNMPTGIINTLNEQQVLDLLAYLISDGKETHPAFQKPPPEKP
jgi:putative heme-binding domain-containing protein